MYMCEVGPGDPWIWGNCRHLAKGLGFGFTHGDEEMGKTEFGGLQGKAKDQFIPNPD